MRNPRNPLSILAAAGLAILLAACGAANGDNAGDSGGAAAAESGSSSGGGETVATVGGESISRSEMEDYLKTVNPKAVQAYYDAQNQALNALINNRLMEKAAAAEGIDAQQLQSRILQEVPEVTEEQIKQFYDQNQNRMGLKSLDAMRDQIRAYLVNQGQQQALSNFLDEQKEKQGVAVHLDPPRVEVAIAANDPYKGPEGAAVTIVEFSDFQ